MMSMDLTSGQAERPPTGYSSIVPLAEDLLAAPASQAFVERVFSLCGLLTSGRRNRMSKS